MLHPHMLKVKINKHQNMHSQQYSFATVKLAWAFSTTVGGILVPSIVLPPLPYPYNALEPYISEQIMVLHHQKHHQKHCWTLCRVQATVQTPALELGTMECAMSRALVLSDA